MTGTAPIEFHERRRAPVREFTLVPAAFLVLAGFALHRPIAIVLSVVAAIAIAVAGQRFHRTHWIEDYVLTADRLEARAPTGIGWTLALADVVGVTIRGNRATLEHRDGRRYVLGHVRRIRAFQKQLEAALPSLSIALEWDPLCRT